LTSPRELTRGGCLRNRLAGPGVLRSPEPRRAIKKLKPALRARPFWSALVDSQHSFALRRAASRRDGAGPCPSVRTSPPSCEETAPTVFASAIPPRPDAPCSSAAARRGGSGSLPPRRRSSPGGTVVARAVAAEGFPRSARIRKRADFLRVQQRGKKVSSGPLVGLVLPTSGPTARLGLTVSSKVGNAVVRARVKRQLREVFRRRRHSCPAVELVVIARPAARDASSAELARAFGALLSSLERLSP
jgi:ribonuclease P protein component